MHPFAVEEFRLQRQASIQVEDSNIPHPAATLRIRIASRDRSQPNLPTPGPVTDHRLGRQEDHVCMAENNA